MEHLLLPDCPILSASLPLIPCVGEPYDGGDFDGYMVRRGVDEDQLFGREDSRSVSEHEALAFLQSWLFFGLLAKVCGQEGHYDDFQRFDTASGSVVLCTRQLRRRFQAQEKLRALLFDQDRGIYPQRDTITYLNVVHGVVSKMVLQKPAYLSSLIMLSIVSLWDFVRRNTAWTVDVFEMTQEVQFPNIPSQTLKKHVVQDVKAFGNVLYLPEQATLLLQQSMEKAGWCPTNVKRLNVDFDLASLFLMSSLPCPDIGKSHHKCRATMYDGLCKAYNIDDPNHYPQKHVARCDASECPQVGPDPAQLEKALRRGYIPTVKFYAHPKRPRLSIKRFISGSKIARSTNYSQISIKNFKPGAKVSKFVTISHVWSDGLGNPHANTMPLCQVQRISQYARDVAGTDAEVPFWIDTLLCPVAEGVPQNLAIERMRETYVDAEKVLVLTSYLMDSHKPTSSLEILARLIVTNWTRRLWTLQEGVLARAVLLQFRDVAVDLSDVLRAAEQEVAQQFGSTTTEFEGILNAARNLNESWRIRKQRMQATTLKFLRSQLRWRSTSVPTDEGLCVSALLGFPLKKILSVAPEKRMTQLWRLIHTPPFAALFWSGGRLTDYGFRWAPKSFLGNPAASFTQSTLLNGNFVAYDHEFEDDAEHLHLDPQGLRIQRTAVDLGRWNASIKTSFWVYTPAQPNESYLVVRVPDQVSKHEIVQDLHLDEVDYDVRRLFLIFSQPWKRYMNDPGYNLRGMSALLLSSSHNAPHNSPIVARIESLCVFLQAKIVSTAQNEAVSGIISDFGHHGNRRTDKMLPSVLDGVPKLVKTQIQRDQDGFLKFTQQNALVIAECGFRSPAQQWCLE